MINRNEYIELRANGKLKLLKTGKVVTPVNPVVLIDGNTIYFDTNNGTGCMDVVVYLRLRYWAERMTYDHKGPGVLALHNAVEHKSIPAEIMGTDSDEDEYVGYLNGDRMDCRKSNLTIFHKKAKDN